MLPVAAAGMSALGASALSAGVGAFGNIVGSVAGGLFSANQARKNRAFQERMYKKQVEDTINFWKMQNEYNLPSAVYQRELEGMKANGLNPLLMYENGSMSGNLASQPQLPSAPHGAQGQVGSFNTRIDLANLALVEAQANALNSQANLNDTQANNVEEQTQGVKFNNELNNRLKDMLIALKYDEHDMFKHQMSKIDNDIYWTSQLGLQNSLTLQQARLYQAKEYDLHAWELGERFRIEWENVATGKRMANAAWKNACANMLSSVAQFNLSNAQIGFVASQTALNWQQHSFNKDMNKELLNNARWMSQKYRSEVSLNDQKAANTYLQNIYQGMNNSYYRQYGVDQLPTGHLMKEVLPVGKQVNNALGKFGWQPELINPFALPINILQP